MDCFVRIVHKTVKGPYFGRRSIIGPYLDILLVVHISTGQNSHQFQIWPLVRQILENGPSKATMARGKAFLSEYFSPHIQQGKAIEHSSRTHYL